MVPRAELVATIFNRGGFFPFLKKKNYWMDGDLPLRLQTKECSYPPTDLILRQIPTSLYPNLNIFGGILTPCV